MDNLGSVLPLLLILGAGYLLVLRPARARQAQQRALRASVAPGARVMTTAGMFATVTAVDGDEVELEIADGVRVRYVAAAIARVVDQAATDEAAPTDATLGLGDDTPAA